MIELCGVKHYTTKEVRRMFGNCCYLSMARYAKKAGVLGKRMGKCIYYTESQIDKISNSLENGK